VFGEEPIVLSTKLHIPAPRPGFVPRPLSRSAPRMNLTKNTTHIQLLADADHP